MPLRTPAPEGAPCWIELGTSDPDRARDFYGELFGWTFEVGSEEYGGYTNCYQDGRIVAGLMGFAPGAEQPDVWSTYLSVADTTATVARAQGAGGVVVVEPMQVLTQGTMAFVLDPGGAPVGAWQPGDHQGYAVHLEHGTPVWHELHTGEFSTTVAFYESVFGWQTEVRGDSDEFRYTVQMADGEQRAGVMDASGWLPQTGSAWSVYLGATDVDATLADVTRLGGTVTMAAEDTPFGRLASVTDPGGAAFRLSSLPG